MSTAVFAPIVRGPTAVNGRSRRSRARRRRDFAAIEDDRRFGDTLVGRRYKQRGAAIQADGRI